MQGDLLLLKNESANIVLFLSLMYGVLRISLLISRHGVVIQEVLQKQLCIQNISKVTRLF